MVVDDEVREAIARLPELLAIDAETASVRQLEGLTNRSFRIDEGGRSFVLRLPGPATELYIDRAAEARHARAAHAVGLSPELFFADAESGVALYDYSPLPPVRGDALRADAAQQARCAATLRRLHEDVTGFVATFDPFERIDPWGGKMSCGPFVLAVKTTEHPVPSDGGGGAGPRPRLPAARRIEAGRHGAAAGCAGEGHRGCRLGDEHLRPRVLTVTVGVDPMLPIVPIVGRQSQRDLGDDRLLNDRWR